MNPILIDLPNLMFAPLNASQWNVKPSPDHDWTGLKARIAQHGLRNSLSVAVMPTASTANIFGK